MAAGEEPEMVEVTLRAVGPSRPSTIRLPPSLSVSDLRRHIAHDRRLPEDRLRLVLRGRNLPCQDDALVNLRHGDSLMVAVAPKPPANHLRDDADDDDDEEELKFKIPETTTWWKRKIFIFLRDKLRLPDILLMALFSLNMKAWVLIAMWFLFAPIAQMYEVGPLYVGDAGGDLAHLPPPEPGVDEAVAVLLLHAPQLGVDAERLPVLLRLPPPEHGELAHAPEPPLCLFQQRPELIRRPAGAGLGSLILGTGFVVILCNLGRRQQGDVSAYSIFNEDFRELPGTLNADRIDRDIRAGGKMINPPSNRQKYSLSLTPL
uniref:Ubiquitin-like domain-containing protein n=1 Tax=Leersia perrieri TaxID=77586 RepID=A0A0D9XH49_9ORYZ